MNGLNSATLQTKMGSNGNFGKANCNGNSFGYSNTNTKDPEKALKLAAVVIYQQRKRIEELEQQSKTRSDKNNLNLFA